MLETLITIAVLHWAVLILPGFNFLLIGQLAEEQPELAASLVGPRVRKGVSKVDINWWDRL